jgi:hypothetical protein
MKWDSVTLMGSFFLLFLLGIADLLSLKYETIEVGTFVNLTASKMYPDAPNYLVEHYQYNGHEKCTIQSLYSLNETLTLVALNETVFGSTKKLWIRTSGGCLDEVHRSYYLYSGGGLIVPFIAFLIFLIIFGIPPALVPSEKRVIDTALEMSTTPPAPNPTTLNPPVSPPLSTRPTRECDTPMP